MVDAKLKIEDRLFDKERFDSAAALGCISHLMQKHVGLNRDKVSMLTLHERVDISGGSDAPKHLRHGPDQIASYLIDAEEKEKRRIARELHDGLGQLLTSINLHTQQCLNVSDGSDEVSQVVKESLQVISNMAKQAMVEMRGICSALRPAILDDLGVLAAIKWQSRQISQAHDAMSVTTQNDLCESDIPENYKTAIYRIVQEALNNAVKYSKADNLLIKLDRVGDYLQLIVKDDGVGFNREQTRRGMGLMSMQERAESVGGLFQLNSKPGMGVELRVLFPIERLALSG